MKWQMKEEDERKDLLIKQKNSSSISFKAFAQFNTHSLHFTKSV